MHGNITVAYRDYRTTCMTITYSRTWTLHSRKLLSQLSTGSGLREKLYGYGVCKQVLLRVDGLDVRAVRTSHACIPNTESKLDARNVKRQRPDRDPVQPDGNGSRIRNSGEITIFQSAVGRYGCRKKPRNTRIYTCISHVKYYWSWWSHTGAVQVTFTGGVPQQGRAWTNGRRWGLWDIQQCKTCQNGICFHEFCVGDSSLWCRFYRVDNNGR